MIDQRHHHHHQVDLSFQKKTPFSLSVKGNTKPKKQYYNNDSSYYDNDYYNYPQRPQLKTPKTKVIEPEVKENQASSTKKDTSGSEPESVRKKR